MWYFDLVQTEEFPIQTAMTDGTSNGKVSKIIIISIQIIHDGDDFVNFVATETIWTKGTIA